jgi:hypothetical protein
LAAIVLTADPLTFPHDYRVLFSGETKPVVVGGQAINLWAITFLESGDPALAASKYGSGDMDLLQDDRVLAMLRSLPGWRYEKPSLWNFGEIRTGFAFGKTEDGRPLLVEVLSKINGLDAADLTAVATVNVGSIEYRLLDPLVMLKAKCANVRGLKQDGNPPRHDRDHLHIIAQCFPRYLSYLFEKAASDPLFEKDASTGVSRAFAILTDRKIAATLIAERIDPRSLVPQELATSTVEKIRRAFEFQMPRVAGLPTEKSAKNNPPTLDASENDTPTPRM